MLGARDKGNLDTGVFIALAFVMRSWLSVVYLLQHEQFLWVVINAWWGLA